jgi:hypothetical protein
MPRAGLGQLRERRYRETTGTPAAPTSGKICRGSIAQQLHEFLIRRSPDRSPRNREDDARAGIEVESFQGVERELPINAIVRARAAASLRVTDLSPRTPYRRIVCIRRATMQRATRDPFPAEPEPVA